MATIFEIADSTRAALLANERAAFGRMRDAYGLIYRKLQDDLAALTADITAARARGETVNLAWLNQEQRYHTLLDQTRAEIQRFSVIAGQEIRDQQQAAVDLAQERAEQMVMAGLGPFPPGATIVWHRLPRQSTEALVGFLSDGSPLSELLDELGPQASRDVRAALIRGVGTGLGPREIARMVREALGGNLVRALKVSRDSVMRSHREATHRSYGENRDILRGWVWHAQLGPRTCPICLSQHGSFHRFDERLESHVQCRCAMVPVTKTWAELGFKGIPETPLVTQSGADWFSEQPAAFQRALLGKSKYAAYQAGDLELADLVGVHHSRRWGKSLYERSLRDVVGERAARRYQAAAD